MNKLDLQNNESIFWASQLSQDGHARIVHCSQCLDLQRPLKVGVAGRSSYERIVGSKSLRRFVFGMWDCFCRVLDVSLMVCRSRLQ